MYNRYFRFLTPLETAPRVYITPTQYSIRFGNHVWVVAPIPNVMCMDSPCLARTIDTVEFKKRAMKIRYRVRVRRILLYIISRCKSAPWRNKIFFSTLSRMNEGGKIPYIEHIHYGIRGRGMFPSCLDPLFDSQGQQEAVGVANHGSHVSHLACFAMPLGK